jgi:transcriptional regulator with XRE-family HTH domain
MSAGMTIEKRIEQARRQVQERVGQHREIASALGVSYNWVRRFVSGALQEPGAIKFAHLEEWLKRRADQ